MRKVISVILKVICGIFCAALLLVIATGISPVYDFRPPKPFSGPDIFNPYRDLDSSLMWKRSVFHVHTKVKGPFPVNECDFWPEEVYEAYERFGYDIVTFSNHNEITAHPFDSTLQVNVYEQGYSPYKFHKLVFGSQRVRHWDPLVPVLASQKQFELERLGKDSDFIQINHPYRTWGMSKSHMQKLSGYEIMELDTGVSTENEYWDWALSAGHYSFGLANDDLHYPDRPGRIAVRCNFLATPSGRYEDIRSTLLGGAYYAMRVPNYGKGDWEEKYRRNASLPFVQDIGLREDTVYIALSEAADSIRVTGQDHATLFLAKDTDRLEYVMKPEDSYARLTAYFPGKEVIYSNPFARYDSSVSDAPPDEAPMRVNVLLTILFNLLLLALAAGVTAAIVYLVRKC